jgi:DNA polymerase III epsilon subunit-like protein
MTNIAFVDCETTGLDPDKHEIWELGLVLANDGGERLERSWFLPVHEFDGDPFSLDVGGFHERHPFGYDQRKRTSGRGYETDSSPASIPTVVLEFTKLTTGAHLAGAVVSFDAEFLRRLLLKHGYRPRWHYHLVDVEALAAGALGMRPPWNSDDLSKAVGVDPEQFKRHTALGDARWAEAIYERVMALEGKP